MDPAGSGMNLPDDVIVDILSYLPVKSILRFKCVGKSWLKITQQEFFIKKHQMRSQIIYEYEPEYEDYYYLYCFNGLVVEENREAGGGEYRIRNPATKQVTSLVLERKTRFILGFDPSTSKYKILKFYFIKETCDVGISMSNIGSDDDLAWTTLDITLLLDGEIRFLSDICHKDVCYLAACSFSKLENSDIIRFTMDGKSSMRIKVPPSFQWVEEVGTENVRWLNVRWLKFQVFILGDEKLTLGFIVRDSFYVWVLEDYKESIWSERKIIHLNFIKDYPNPGTITLWPSPNLDQLRVTIANHYVEYDVHSKTYTCLAEVPPGKQILYSRIPSLVSLKGMHSEDPSIITV